MFIKKSTFVAGFAMFSMFFGSGNLVFPMIVGSFCGDLLTPAIIGWISTAVLIPLIGLLGMVRAEGNQYVYFNILPKKIVFLLIFFLLALIGPFGVVPRCITVSYGGFSQMFPNFPLWAFSGAFCLIVLILIWNPTKVVDIIGKILTPFKLGSIIILIVIGFFFSPSLTPSNTEFNEVLKLSFKSGYNTMDLLGTFFFTSPIMMYLSRDNIDKKSLFKQSCWASIIAGITLCLVYCGLINLAARYHSELKFIAPESMLAFVTNKALGDHATFIVSMVVMVSCLTTATILSSVWSDFLHKDILNKKISYKTVVIFSIFITFFVSLLGFSKIANFLSNILGWIYPLLLIHGVYKIIVYKKDFSLK
jgi:LIVCS family branched-chain amino acid:cation transporter